jgi:O-antigen/teichoic acid export membrane protein
MVYSMGNESIFYKFLNNTFWLILQNVYSMVLSLVVGSLSARYLGPSNYGLIGYGVSIINIFITLSRLGLDSIVVNEVIVNPEKKSGYLGTAIVLRLFVSVLSVICILVIVIILEPNNHLLISITFFQSFEIIFRVYEVFNYWFQAELKSKFFVIVSMIALTVTSIWRIVLLKVGADVQLFALSTSIQAFAILVLTGSIFLRVHYGSLSFSLQNARYLLGKSYHFIISSIAISLYMQMDRVMLGKMVSKEVVGYYTAASTISTLWIFIPNAIINSARPLILSVRNSNLLEYIKRIKILYLSITLIVLFVGVCICLFGKYAILLLFGESYIEAVPVVNVLVWAAGVSMIGSCRSIWLIAENKGHYEKNILVLGAILNFFINYIGIKIMGLYGAALATLISQIFVVFLAPTLFKSIRQFLNMYIMSFRMMKELINIIKYRLVINKNR